MKKRWLLPVIGAILFISVLGLAFLKLGKKSSREEVLQPTPTVTLSPVDEKVEVSLTPRYDKKAVILKISQIPLETGSIDYELSYETGEGLPRGVLGTIHLKEKEESVEREILLGTCSRNVCVYDTGVEKVNLVLKFNSSEGSSQFQKEYEL